MSASAILKELKGMGDAGYRRIIMNHGAQEDAFGVKIAELKKLVKREKTNHALALELYATGNYDAMYLAGLIADDAKMTTAELHRWALHASPPLATSTVAWVAAGSPNGWKAALKWIESKTDSVAAAGWATLTSIVSTQPDKDLDLPALEKLLMRVKKTIHPAPNGARKAMNGFVIAVGAYVAPLSEAAVKVGEAIGPVTVDVGNTACEIPFAPDAIAKVAARGSIGKKRKSAKC
jgi:3-methyladenine DNA glycosylase AlkD